MKRHTKSHAMSSSHASQLTVGQCATLACLLEATAPKPGNVHRSADFEDLTFSDFVASAVAIGPAMQHVRQTGVGAAVLTAIQSTRQLVSTNTNLGTVLLLAPLAAVDLQQGWQLGISAVLTDLTPKDAGNIYAAIRAASPGALGKVDKMDVAEEPPADILAAMQAAADRDLVARQYVDNFRTVLERVAPALVAGTGRGWALTDTIIHVQVSLMSDYPDSLIARKCGEQIAQEAAERAAEVVAAGMPGSSAYFDALGHLDFWLRGDSHRRNPGTTADLIAAGLFAALRDGTLRPPFQ